MKPNGFLFSIAAALIAIAAMTSQAAAPKQPGPTSGNPCGSQAEKFA